MINQWIEKSNYNWCKKHLSGFVDCPFKILETHGKSSYEASLVYELPELDHFDKSLADEPKQHQLVAELYSKNRNTFNMFLDLEKEGSGFEVDLRYCDGYSFDLNNHVVFLPFLKWNRESTFDKGISQ